MPRTKRVDWIGLLKETWAEFGRHKAQWLAAAISYFTMFAIAPLIIVVVEIAGLFLGHHRTALDNVMGYLQHTAGKAAASGVRSMVIAAFSQHRAGIIAQAIGWAVFVLGAIGLFSSLQEALNTVWDVEPEKKSVLALVRDRATSFGVVLAIAFVLLVSLGLNAVLTIAAGAMQDVFPLFPTLIKIVDFILSFAVIAVLFALLFRYLPESEIEWRDVWLGGAATALLFVIGQFLLGWYLGRAGISTSFGAFGSLVVFLVWVNYSAQIMLFGAEFTHVYARKHGSRCKSA
ncbi:MAG TPA: YihY/virulence factor BrkB family protein [Candidatus Rubrimentiphilum sp.]|nr:YihY/virulence factor BrkB family protein [Candidatus Rubrimentiphilum sp.]